MYVIGTAGHVDHGKSTLVEALTGINPDRLKEERERQMTIDLGFAWLTLPNGEAVGVVDVPGHQDFIGNMLAGVGGIDAALLVVAADEGVMPQTREHLAILDLLQIPTGMVVLSKADLVDEEWLGLMTAEVRAALQGTVLAQASIVPVSARTGAGLPELIRQLQAVLAAKPPRRDVGKARLPVDRVFSVAGFGTVVTGTLLDGQLGLGDEVELLPGGLAARIRGLQTHRNKVETGHPSSRLAINLAGVDVDQVRRGMVVARPGTLAATTMLDAYIRLVPQATLPLKHNSAIKLYVGASETLGNARLLEVDALAPGESGWAQLVLAEPAVVVKGERFVLRRPSPGETIGGGIVANPHPERRHRRHDAAALTRLETQLSGTPAERLLEVLDRLGPVPLAAALAETGQKPADGQMAAAELTQSGELIEMDGLALVASRQAWANFAADLRALTSAYHAAHPLKAGMPREELKSRLAQRSEAGRRASSTARTFNTLLAHAAATGALAAEGSLVRLPDYQVRYSDQELALVSTLVAGFERDPYNTPAVKLCAAQVGGELLAALLEQGRLVQVSSEVVFLAETYAEMAQVVREMLEASGKITVAEVRDRFKTSRKYALALMEYLDEQGVTVRAGDERVLRRPMRAQN